MSIKKNFIFQNLYVSLDALFPLIVFPYVSRKLGPEYIGLINFANYVAFYFILLGFFGIVLYGIRETAKTRLDIEKRNTLLTELTALLTITSVVSFILYFVFLYITNPNIPVTLAIVVGLPIICVPISFEWFFAGLEDYKYLGIRSLFIKTISIVLIFYFVNEPSDFIKYQEIVIGSTILGFLFNIYYGKVRHKVNFVFKGLNIIRHFKSAFILFLSGLLGHLYISLDVIFLAYLASNESVGYYIPGVKIARMLIISISTLGTVLLPRISYYIEENKEAEVSKLISKNFGFVFVVSLPIVAFLYFYFPDLIYLFAGSKYQLGYSSAKILCPIVLLASLNFLYSMQILLPRNKENIILLISALGVVTNVVLDLLFIPLYKHNGAAISVLGTESIVLLLNIYFSKKLLKLSGLKINYFVYGIGLFIVFSFFNLSSMFPIINNKFLNISFYSFITMIAYGIYMIFISKEPVANEIYMYLRSKIKH